MNATKGTQIGNGCDICNFGFYKAWEELSKLGEEPTMIICSSYWTPEAEYFAGRHELDVVALPVHFTSMDGWALIGNKKYVYSFGA